MFFKGRTRDPSCTLLLPGACPASGLLGRDEFAAVGCESVPKDALGLGHGVVIAVYGVVTVGRHPLHISPVPCLESKPVGPLVLQ